MKRKLIIIIIFAAISLIFMGNFYRANAGVDVSIGINIPLPGLVITGQPALVVIPGTYVYYAPDIGAELFFYHSHWYRLHNSGWYVSINFGGPWIVAREVPHAIRNLPPGYRNIPPGYPRFPYGHIKKTWETWERNRYWDKRQWLRDNNNFKRDKGRAKGHGRGKGRSRK